MRRLTPPRHCRIGVPLLLLGALFLLLLPAAAIPPLGGPVCWGAGKTSTGVYPEYGQSQPPAVTDAIAVAAGDYHTVLLRATHQVVAFGATVGTLGDYPNLGQSNVPSSLNDGGNVLAIAAGSLHTLALKGDGTVVAWGNAMCLPAWRT